MSKIIKKKKKTCFITKLRVCMHSLCTIFSIGGGEDVCNTIKVNYDIQFTFLFKVKVKLQSVSEFQDRVGVILAIAFYVFTPLRNELYSM